MASRFCVAVSSASTGSNAWGEVWPELPDKRQVLIRVSLSGTPTCFDLVQSQRQCLLQLRCSRLAYCQVKPLKIAVPMPTGSRRPHFWVLGFCKTKHRKDHYVRALGDHYAGKGRCVRNGPSWTGRRSVEWGPYYEPRNQSGSVTFEGPHGERLKLESRVPSAMA